MFVSVILFACLMKQLICALYSHSFIRLSILIDETVFIVSDLFHVKPYSLIFRGYVLKSIDFM